MPKSISLVSANLFSGCSRFESVHLSENLSMITRNMFKDCISLKSIIVGKKVNRIHDFAFSGCTKLEKIRFLGDAPIYKPTSFKGVSPNAKVFINPEATGFGETFAGLPVVIQERIEINTFSKSDSPFTISFESKSGSTYIIEVSHNLKQWGKIGEVQGTGSSVKFTDPRLPIVPFERNYFRVKLVE